jgi:uncharacterized protein YndB with AHSA1/START domain/mannose-6-phosphate isomerase-like protein (cupin superfamily)
MEPLIITNQVTIDASPAIVWDALVNPSQTRKYMFGCEAISDWKKGSILDWKGNYNGKEMIFVTGKITDIVPGKFLAYTTFDPNSAMENIPENHLTVTYTLAPEGNGTKLIVTQGNYNTVAEGERRYKEAYNNGEGWNPILAEIKKLLENKEYNYVTRMDVKYKHLEKIDIPQMVKECTDKWFNQTLTEVNDSVVRVGIIEGEYHWHKHENDDEFFLVLEGQLFIDLEGQTMELNPGQGVTLSKGVMHRPRAPKKTVILMVETKEIKPTGD